MLRTYPGYDDEKLLRMRLDRFWLLHRNVDRLAAEEDIRHLRVQASVGTGEGVKSTFTDLSAQMGKIAVYDEGRAAIARAQRECDLSGLAGIRDLGGAL